VGGSYRQSAAALQSGALNWQHGMSCSRCAWSPHRNSDRGTDCGTSPRCPCIRLPSTERRQLKGIIHADIIYHLFIIYYEIRTQGTI